jgi:transposase-like protein
MTKRDDAMHRARYTLEFKLEAIRRLKGPQEWINAQNQAQTRRIQRGTRSGLGW